MGDSLPTPPGSLGLRELDQLRCHYVRQSFLSDPVEVAIRRHSAIDVMGLAGVVDMSRVGEVASIVKCPIIPWFCMSNGMDKAGDCCGTFVEMLVFTF